MGSRMMHYAIANHISNQTNLGLDFLIGSIAPDVNKNSKTPKELTHFMKIRADGEHDMFPDIFLSEYGKELSPFKLGYYLHLISDEIWLKTIYKRVILENKTDTKDQALKKFYLDFHFFNRKLIEKYQLKPIGNVPSIVTGVTEIVDADIPEIINDLNSDFLDKSQMTVSQIISKKAIDDYIETCTDQFMAFLTENGLD
ncbi:hypothetical protein ACVPPR_08510 [Dellaglioa sp. L3N]